MTAKSNDMGDRPKLRVVGALAHAPVSGAMFVVLILAVGLLLYVANGGSPALTAAGLVVFVVAPFFLMDRLATGLQNGGLWVGESSVCVFVGGTREEYDRSRVTVARVRRGLVGHLTIAVDGGDSLIVPASRHRWKAGAADLKWRSDRDALFRWHKAQWHSSVDTADAFLGAVLGSG